MTPSEAYKISRNPDDYSAAEVKEANKVLKAYSEVTERDRTPPRKKPTKPTKKRKPKKNALSFTMEDLPKQCLSVIHAD